MDLEKEQVEVAMRRQGHSENVERVISMESESALPKGENYLSTIYRVTLRVVLGNGRTAKRSLILKVVPKEKAKTELIKNMGVFKTEIMMYTRVLLEMEALMDEFGDTNDPLWCRLVHYEPYSSLLLEDLKASGFRMTRRQDCLDLDHSLLVLRSLGRFHAMSKVLEQRGIISKDDYKPYPLVNDKNLIKYFMYYGLQTLAKAMEEHWGPEWHDVAQKLRVPPEVLEEKMLKLGEVDEKRFNCLNHGDCWSNNMMFKYDWQNRPFTMRFVDYQVVYYQSPAFDLTYTLYTTVHAGVRRQHWGQLIAAYHTSLTASLEEFGCGKPGPSLAELEASLESLALLRVVLSTFFRAVMTDDSEEPIDMELILASGGKKGHCVKPYATESFRKMVEPDLRDLVKKGMAGF